MDTINSIITKIKFEFYNLLKELKRVYHKDNLLTLLKPKGLLDIVKKGLFILLIFLAFDHLGNMVTYTRHKLNTPEFAKTHNLELIKRHSIDDSAFLDIYFSQSPLSNISDIQLYTNGKDALLETRYFIITPKGDGLKNTLEHHEANDTTLHIDGVNFTWNGYSNAIRQMSSIAGLDRGYIANYMIIVLNPYDTNDPYNFPFIHLAPNSFANIENFGLKEYSIPFEDVHLIKEKQ